MIAKSGVCPFCQAEGHPGPRANCYAHCHEAADGVHVPDMRHAEVGEGDDGDHAVLDFACKHCHVSGSVRVAAKDIVFE